MTRGGALFDPTGTYRYVLWRRWDPAAPRVAFILLNPSTADAASDDPTIRRCVGFAARWGFGSLEVVNLFALCAADPVELRRAADPVGPLNDGHILRAARRTAAVVAGWGNLGALRDRDRGVIRLLRGRAILSCLGRTLSGRPRHPLYLGAGVVPEPFEPRRHSEGVSVRSARA